MERDKERERDERVPRHSISFDHPPFPASSCSNLRLTSATVNFGGKLGITDIQPACKPMKREAFQKRRYRAHPRYGCAPARGKRAEASERMGAKGRRGWRNLEKTRRRDFEAFRIDSV